jgi:acyl-CoA synthetase (AMP-forming)/AMP-acid ligase II
MTHKAAAAESSRITDVLRFRAEHQPDRTAYTFLRQGDEGLSFTYAELLSRASSIAGLIRDAGTDVKPVLLMLPAGLDYVAALLACFVAGRIAVPAFPPGNRRHLPRLELMAADSGAGICITDRKTILHRRITDASETHLKSLHWIAVEDIPQGHVHVPGDGTYRDDIALLQYTSGSTSNPKGVVVSHTNLSHNLRAIQRAFGNTPESRSVTWLPMFHDMGLVDGILQPLFTGFPCVILSPAAFVARPLTWLETISRYRATISGGPDSAYQLCTQRTTEAQKAGLDLSSWSIAYNGAETIRVETMQAFVSAFAQCGFRRQSFRPCYGLAEATLAVTCRTDASTLNTLTVDLDRLKFGDVSVAGDVRVRTVVSCGPPVEGTRVMIVDTLQCKPCPSGQVGEIWVAGLGVTRG